MPQPPLNFHHSAQDSRFKVFNVICTERKHPALYNEVLPLLSTECQQCKKKEDFLQHMNIFYRSGILYPSCNRVALWEFFFFFFFASSVNPALACPSTLWMYN